MADKRKHTVRLVMEQDGVVTVARLYPSDQWPGKPGVGEGLFRMKIAKAWHCPAGQRYAFYTLEEAFAVLAGIAPKAVAGESAPVLPVGSVVRVFPEDRPMPTLTRTRTIPFQGPDGRWRVFVGLFDEPFLVEGLQVNPGVTMSARSAGASPHLASGNKAKKGAGR